MTNDKASVGGDRTVFCRTAVRFYSDKTDIFQHKSFPSSEFKMLFTNPEEYAASVGFFCISIKGYIDKLCRV